MKGLVDWATDHARTVLAFIILSLVAGAIAYSTLPKEGAPDVEIPILFVSVPFSGISAEDSEKLIVKPLETQLKGLAGLKKISGTAAQGYGGVLMEFDFGWDKTAIMAQVRDKVNTAESQFPQGADQYSINEVSFDGFPILVVTLSGALPERELLRVAKDLQERVEGLPSVLEVGLAGHRPEMMEVLIDPLKLEAYNVTAGELLSVVRNNNLLIAAGTLKTETGDFAFKIPSSFNSLGDIQGLPIKTNGDRVITMGDLADIRLTFVESIGTARFNGEPTVALQVVKARGSNLIDAVAQIRETVAEVQAEWPIELQNRVTVGFASDQSVEVKSMVDQLESSVLTAIALVMIVILGALGIRSAFLVGFAVPTSFLLSFFLMGVLDITISNMVMFGLILAVGMLVDGSIVVVEYADKRITAGTGPMKAYGEAAKRMFWPIVSSTATTLCAFLPLLFWPGVPGQFMRVLPITLIFVLSASLLVTLVFLPVIGGITGRISRSLDNVAHSMRSLPKAVRLILMAVCVALIYFGLRGLLGGNFIIGGILFMAGFIGMATTSTSMRKPVVMEEHDPDKRSLFGHFIHFLVGNPIMPFVVILVTIGFVFSVFTLYGNNNRGVEFFVDTEPEQALVYIRARGNLSLAEKDDLVLQAEALVQGIEGIESVFSSAGVGGLNNNTGGGQAPRDTIGTLQLALTEWGSRLNGPTGKEIIDTVNERIANIPGAQAEVLLLEGGPSSGKPLVVRLKGQNWEDLHNATQIITDKFEADADIIDVDDSRPLPGIDWQVNVDVARAGRYQADVAQVGAMVQLVTQGLHIGNMRLDSVDDEVDIRVRLPQKDRLLSTLENLRIRTGSGLIPLSNFVTLEPVPTLAEINRESGRRYFDIKAGVTDGTNANAKIGEMTEWLEDENPLPRSVAWEWAGDQQDQADSQQFLIYAFSGALMLMFILLLAQFNSFYHAALVLVAVVLSTTGVLIGMMVRDQTFSIIMTGIGIVALAGIVVNNNIVLLDTYQEYTRRMPPLLAIVRTAEARIRPVLLTTITTMAGLTPMMFGISIDFYNGGYTIDAPAAVWWKQLSTAVVFGLGIATFLTLLVTPSLLAIRVWVGKGAYAGAGAIGRRIVGMFAS